jgi:hypothetical protein
VTFSVAEPLVPPLDELLELEVEATGVVEVTGTETTGVKATGVEATGVEATGVEATGVEATGVDATEVEATAVEAIGVLPVLVLESVPVPVFCGAATATLASAADPALCVEPPHPDSRITEMVKAPRIRVKSPRRRSIFMCIASLMAKSPKSALAIADR